MKHLIWLAFLLPIVANANPYTVQFCIDNPTNDICVGFNLDRARLDLIESEQSQQNSRLDALEGGNGESSGPTAVKDTSNRIIPLASIVKIEGVFNASQSWCSVAVKYFTTSATSLESATIAQPASSSQADCNDVQLPAVAVAIGFTITDP